MPNKKWIMKLFKYTLILFSLTFMSCEDTPEYTPEAYKDVELTLDDGKKWEVPSTMMIHMDSAMTLISTMKDASAADDLIRYKDGFVSNCSMPGEGHDVLHAWLMPYIGLLEELETTNNENDFNRLKVELEESKHLFNKYFK